MKELLPLEAAAPEPVLQIGDVSLPEPPTFELNEAEKEELRGIQAQLLELGKSKAVLRAGEQELAASVLLAFDEFREDGLALVDVELGRLAGPRVEVLPLRMLATAEIREEYELQARLLRLEGGADLVLLPVALEAGRQHCALAVLARRLQHGLWTVADPLARFSESHAKARALAAWLAMSPFQQLATWTYLPLPPLPPPRSSHFFSSLPRSLNEISLAGWASRQAILLPTAI